MMNCMLWVFYGLLVVHKDSLLVTAINAVGMGFEAFYITVCLVYCGGKKNFRRNICLFLVPEVIVVAVIVLITLFTIKNSFAKQTFVGVICDIFNIAMYGAPSLVIKKSDQDKERQVEVNFVVQRVSGPNTSVDETNKG